MSSVLVLADAPEIEALLADLVLFAGYHPVFVQLRSDGLSRTRAFELVSTAMHESAEAIGAPELVVTLERDTAEWVDEVYRVA